MLAVGLSSMTEAVESKTHRLCQQPYFLSGGKSHSKGRKEADGLRYG